MVNKERLQLGLDALRSGEFEQCAGELRRTILGKVHYCCLGVLTEVAVRNGLVIVNVCANCGSNDCGHELDPAADQSVTDDVWAIHGEILSKPVMDWYGFSYSDPTIGEDADSDPIMATLANDDKHWDFERIADGFESVYITDPSDLTDA